MAAFGTTTRVRLATLAAYALVVLQAMLGIANVAFRLPMVLREAHAANACIVFVAFLGALVFAAVDGTTPVLARHAEPARHTEPAEGAAG